MKTLNKVLLVALVIALGLTMPTTAFAATSPSLGTADSFAILAKTLISNVPTSVITGDVGLDNAGSNYDGLTTGEVSGIIYNTNGTGPDAASGNHPALMTSARDDNTAAFLALSAAPNVDCNPVYATGTGPVDLSGATLVPGVYCADAFELSGVLKLDDTGAADGVWIFRSELSTLITSAGSVAKVQFLTGVGSACNVWWKVASSATLDTGTEFIGNILALTSITMNTGATLNGRALAQTGAVTLQQNTITNGACAAPYEDTTIYPDSTKHSKKISPVEVASSTPTPTPLLPNTGNTPAETNMLWYYIVTPAIILTVLISIYMVRRKKIV